MYLSKKLIAEILKVKDELMALKKSRGESEEFKLIIEHNEQALRLESQESIQYYSEKFNVETKFVYQMGAFYANVLNNIILGNKYSALNSMEPFKFNEIERIFRGKKFKLVLSPFEDYIDIVLNDNTIISSIINNIWRIEKEISSVPIKVFKEIQEPKLLGDSIEINFSGFELEYDDGVSFEKQKLFQIFNNLLLVGIIEDSLISMSTYLKSQNKKDKWDMILAFSKLMESNIVFQQAMVNILTEKNMSPSIELMAAFILSINAKHIPLFKLTKEQHTSKFNEKINLSLNEMDEVFDKDKMLNINSAIASAISTIQGSLKTKELQKDKSLLSIFNRVRGFFENNEVNESLKNGDVDNFWQVIGNNKRIFGEIYSIEPNKLLELCTLEKDAKKMTFEEDLNVNLSDILAVSNNKNLNKGYKKQIYFNLDLTRQFSSTGFNKSEFNIEIFDKTAELFFKNFLNEIYPEVRIGSEFTNISDETFVKNIKNKLYVDKFGSSNNYERKIISENKNQIRFDISKMKVEEIEIFEALVGNLTTVFSHVILKSIKASKQEIDIVNLIKYSLSDEQNAKQQNETIVKNTALLMINNVFGHKDIKENLENFLREKKILMSINKIEKNQEEVGTKIKKKI